MAERNWPELMLLRVERVEVAADGIRLFEFRHPTEAALPPFRPGAHIAVRTPLGVLRNYSLCCDSEECGRYTIAVKREEQGRGGSASMIDRLVVGDEIEVGLPANFFELNQSAPEYIFVAGGIGITPIMSMLHAVERAGDRPFHLYYLTRNASTTAFLRELDHLVLSGNATVHHNDGMLERAFDLWPVFEKPSRAHIYCCGPRGLMDSVRDITGHWPTNQVHFEDFGADLARPRVDDEAFEVQLGRGGPRIEVSVGTTILEAVRGHGRRAASSCESGTCGTCRTRVLEGEPDHRDVVLTEVERRSEIMICVSRAKSNLLVLDL